MRVTLSLTITRKPRQASTPQLTAPAGAGNRSSAFPWVTPQCTPGCADTGCSPRTHGQASPADSRSTGALLFRDCPAGCSRAGFHTHAPAFLRDAVIYAEAARWHSPGCPLTPCAGAPACYGDAHGHKVPA